MKAYGHSRRDKLTCIYGCCGTKSLKQSSFRKFVDKTNRKTARQEGAQDIKNSFKEFTPKED